MTSTRTERETQLEYFTIVDFDDTLFPSSVLTTDILRSFDTERIKYPQTYSYYETELKLLVKHNLELLKATKGYIAIITNSNNVRLDMIFDGTYSKRIASILAPLLRHLDSRAHSIIFSWRDHWMDKHPNQIFKRKHATEAKRLAIYSYLSGCTTNWIDWRSHRPPCLIWIRCIGDGRSEFDGVKAAVNELVKERKGLSFYVERFKYAANPKYIPQLTVQTQMAATIIKCSRSEEVLHKAKIGEKGTKKFKNYYIKAVEA